MNAKTTPAFAELLHKAVNEPGTLSGAYRAFHNYSLGNVLLAAGQCYTRELPLGPLATYNRWRELGRHVKRGEKAITLCQPVTIKRASDDASEEEIIVRFVYRNAWFVLAQTDGQALEPTPIPDWDKDRALAALDIAEIAFDLINGNVMGYARGRAIAINPVNPLKHKTVFHEAAHVLLGHTAQGDQADDDATPHSLAEVEAESVALLCCEALGLPGSEFSRGYIQHWWGQGNEIPERSASRILRVADQILRAGKAEEVRS